MMELHSFDGAMTPRESNKIKTEIMNPKYSLAILTVLAVPHFAFCAEKDKPVKFEALPAPVAAAIKAAAAEAKLDTLVLGDEDGTPAYEATWMANKHKNEIAVAKDGTVLGQEEIITLEETPQAVHAAMTKEAGKNKMLEVEKILGKGKTTYEFTLQKGKAKEVVSFSEDGKILSRENPDAEKAAPKHTKEKAKK